MRALRYFASALVTAAAISAAAACGHEEEAAANVCGEATNRFASCGTSLPLLTGGPCSGASRIVARCVVDHAHDCDELATLLGRIDACVADLLDGGDPLLPPATDLPVPARDGGRDGRAEDASVEDAMPIPIDATLLDGPVDSGPVAWPGLTATGTLGLGEERRFQTPALPAGAYVFAITGTGDADLYVRKSTAPTTTTFDCRPFAPGSNETCSVSLTSPAVVHVMIRGAAASSNFTLEGRHE